MLNSDDFFVEVFDGVLDLFLVFSFSSIFLEMILDKKLNYILFCFYDNNLLKILFINIIKMIYIKLNEFNLLFKFFLFLSNYLNIYTFI